MPRIARIVAPGQAHHITQRGNNRMTVFVDDADRQTYLELLADAVRRQPLEVWSYCLMDNHLHLLAVPGDSTALARGLGRTNLCYTQYFNRKYGSSGRVWQNRFFSCVVEPQHYLWAMVRYIIGNPVRHGLVKRAEAYPWSGARSHLLGSADPLAGEAWLMPEQLAGFRAFAREQNNDIDESIRRATRCGRPFGSATFIAGLEERLKMSIRANPVGRPRKRNG